MLSAVFYALPNFRDKQSITRAALSYELRSSTDLQKEWKKLWKKLEKGRAKRNSIAHSYVASTYYLGGKQSHSIGGPQLFREKNPMRSVIDLNNIRDEFEALQMQLYDFRTKFEEDRELQVS